MSHYVYAPACRRESENVVSYLYDLSGTAGGCPAALLPLRRFFSDGIGKWYIDVSRAVMRGVSFVVPAVVAPQVLLADYLSSGCEARSLLKDLPDNFRRHAALLTLLSPILSFAFPPIVAFIPLAVPASLVLADIAEALRDGKPITAETVSRVLNLGQQWSSVVGSVRPDLAEAASKNAASKVGAAALRSASVPARRSRAGVRTKTRAGARTGDRATTTTKLTTQRRVFVGQDHDLRDSLKRARELNRTGPVTGGAGGEEGFPVVPVALAAGLALLFLSRR